MNDRPKLDPLMYLPNYKIPLYGKELLKHIKEQDKYIDELELKDKEPKTMTQEQRIEELLDIRDNLQKQVEEMNTEYIDRIEDELEEAKELNDLLEKQVEELKASLIGVTDDFDYYISEQDNEPTRAGYLAEAKKLLNQGVNKS